MQKITTSPRLKKIILATVLLLGTASLFAGGVPQKAATLFGFTSSYSDSLNLFGKSMLPRTEAPTSGANNPLVLDTYAPTTTWNVTPILKQFPADRSCAAGSHLVSDQFPNVSNSPGTYSRSYTIDGQQVTVNITSFSDKTFDFTVVNGRMAQMYVKANDYLLYQYDPPVPNASNIGAVTFDTGLHANTNPSGRSYQDVSHLDFCLAAAPPTPEALHVEKTAVGTYDRTVTWELTKTVDDDSHNGAAGEDAGTSNWNVVTNKTETLGNYNVAGTITVTNSNSYAVPFAINDVLNNVAATSPDVICPGSATPDTGTVPARVNGVNGSITCTYEASLLAEDLPDSNSVTVTPNDPAIGGDTQAATVTFAEDELIGDDSVTLADERLDYTQLISDDTTVITPETFPCSSNQADYTNGQYQATETNTATLTGTNTDLSDDASVTVNCSLAALDVSKTADGDYDRTITWDIEKTVSDSSVEALAGESTAPVTWTITVTKDVVENNYIVSGAVNIVNNSAIPQEFTVTDVLNTNPTTNVEVDCDPNAPGNQSFGTVPANDSISCSYSVAQENANATLNTATVTAVGNPNQTATDAIEWTANVEGLEEVTVDDNLGPDNMFPLTTSESDVYTYQETFACSSIQGDYSGGEKITEYLNIASLTELGESARAESTVTVDCTLPALRASKTAAASYDRRVSWTLEKSVDDNSHDGFAGGTAGSSTWTVVADKTETNENYEVTGNITINNPAAIDQTFSVSDVLNDGTVAAVDCLTDTIPAGGNTSCSYTATPAGAAATLNTATVTAPGNEPQTATAAVSFIENLVGYDSGTLSDPRFEYSELVSGDTTETFPETFSCPTDLSLYTNGLYQRTETNTATLNGDINLSDSATVVVNCYGLSVSKTAEEEYTRTYTWDIDKTVDDESFDLFTGDSAIANYTVTVDRTVVDSNYRVAGEITITNPAPMGATLTSVTDTLTGGLNGTVDCPAYVVPSGSSIVCTYTVAPPNADSRTNTATATLNTGVSFSGTADVVFGDPTAVAGYPTVNVTDSFEGELGPASDDATFNYSKTFTCNGDEGQQVNTARIEETGLEASAGVTINCHELEVTKDANTSLTRTWNWTIEKSANQSQLTLMIGQTFTVSYDVTVNTGSVDSGWAVTGDITVANTAPIDATINSVSDVVSPAVPALVDCGVTFPYSLAAGATLNCTYERDLPDATSRTNTATATLQNYSYESGDSTPSGTTGFTGTAPVSFENAAVTEIDESIDVTDTNVGALGTVTNSEAPKTFAYTFEIGPYECGNSVHTNTASFTTNDTDATGSDSANVNVHVPCGTILVRKVVVSTDPGDTPDDFSYTFDGGSPIGFLANGNSPTPHVVNPGEYTIAETPTAGFATMYSGDCNTAGEVTVGDGETKTCTITNVRGNFATNSSLCVYDRNLERDGQQFRALFTQDVQNYPAFKMNATNPGQFFYNVFYSGTPGDSVTFNITLPYPFVTQGAQPIHAYSGVNFTTNDQGETCFLPTGNFYNEAQIVTLGNYINGTYEDLPSPDGDSVGTYSFPVTVEVPASGFIYLNMHLDYGLKGTTGYANSNDNAVRASLLPTLEYLIPNYADHIFSVGGDQTGSSTIENENSFKRNPGTAGFTNTTTGLPVANAQMELWSPKNQKVATAASDTDGWYQLNFKHTGKAQNYTVRWMNNGQVVASKQVTLKANAFAEVSFP